MFSGGLYLNNAVPPVPVLAINGGQTVIGTRADYARSHNSLIVPLIPSLPGVQQVDVAGAVFEKWQFGGHVWFNALDFARKLDLQGRQSKPSRWFQKAAQQWKGMVSKFDLGSLSIRYSQPFSTTVTPDPERCLVYPSFSLGFLILLSVRSFAANDKRSGMVKEGHNRRQYQRVFQALLGRLPEDCRARSQGQGRGGPEGVGLVSGESLHT